MGRKSEWFIMEFSNSSFVDLVNPEKLFFIGNRNFEVAELINLPFEEKTVILYKNKKQALSINSNIR